jgi:hypothetical protein
MWVDTFPSWVYSTGMTDLRQQTNAGRWLRRASPGQRKIAALIAAVIVALFASLYLLQWLHFDFGLILGPCGMKQRTGLPCPTCGMTTSVLAFAQGDLGRAFYVQPAGGFLCSILVTVAFFALLTALSGVYFKALDRLFTGIKVRHWVIGLLIILAAGWAVTMARALAAQAWRW